MKRLFARLCGIRFVESPEAVRVTIPRWMARVMPEVLEDTRRKLLAEHPDCINVLIVHRSVIVRLR